MYSQTSWSTDSKGRRYLLPINPLSEPTDERADELMEHHASEAFTDGWLLSDCAFGWVACLQGMCKFLFDRPELEWEEVTFG